MEARAREMSFVAVRRDDGALRLRQAVNPRKFSAHRFERDSQITPLYFSAREDLLGHEFRFVRRQRKTDPVIISGQSSNLRIYANHFAVHVDQRSAAVTAIDGGIRLQKTLKACEGRRVTLFL